MSEFSQTTERVQALIDQLQQGKPGVQEQLLEVAQNRLRILARQMLKHFSRIRHLEDTDDLLQKTLIRLNQSLGTLRPVSAQAFFSLSSQQMRWCLIDMARSYKKEGQLREEFNGDPDKKPNGKEPTTLDEWSAFHQAAEQLAGMEKNVFDLVYYQGITQVAAAEVLGVAERTVKNYWTQAKLKLANVLKDSDDVA